MEQSVQYQSIEEIQSRKQVLQADIWQENEKISSLLHGLTAPQKANSKGELASHLISNSITAIDAFLFVRKLMKNYGHLFRKRKKR
jgi:hypothetical protein